MGGTLAEGGLTGVASSFGGGTLAGMLAIPAAFAGAAWTLKKSSELTLRNIEIGRSLTRDGYGGGASDTQTGELRSSIQARQGEDRRATDERMKAEAEYQAALQKATGGVRSMLDAAVISSDPRLMEETIRAVAVEASVSMASAKDKAGMSEAMSNQLAGFGLSVGFDQRTQRAKFGVDQNMVKELEDLKKASSAAGKWLGPDIEAANKERIQALESKIAEGEAKAAALNAVKIDKQEIHLHVANFGGTRREAAEAARNIKNAFTDELQKLE
jgi:hypothetical protein